MTHPATAADLPQILAIYQTARDFMKEHGNASQWGDHYPQQELLEEDIRLGQLFVCVEAGAVHGVFAFILGDDPTYNRIDHGAWPNDRPYGTIHRIAGDGSTRGILGRCLQYCRSRSQNIRLDTHADNKVMQHLAAKYGFQRCGIIYLEDGSPRIAYQYCAT